MKESSLKVFWEIMRRFLERLSPRIYKNTEKKRKFDDEVSIFLFPIAFYQKQKLFSIVRCSSDLTTLP